MFLTRLQMDVLFVELENMPYDKVEFDKELEQIIIYDGLHFTVLEFNDTELKMVDYGDL